MAFPNGSHNPQTYLPVWTSAGPAFSVPLGYQQITSLSIATLLTVPTGANVAIIAVSGAGIRYRDDGTAPTALLGFPVAVGQALTYWASLSAVKFIQVAAGAILDIIYYE